MRHSWLSCRQPYLVCDCSERRRDTALETYFRPTRGETTCVVSTLRFNNRLSTSRISYSNAPESSDFLCRRTGCPVVDIYFCCACRKSHPLFCSCLSRHTLWASSSSISDFQHATRDRDCHWVGCARDRHFATFQPACTGTQNIKDEWRFGAPIKLYYYEKHV